MDHETFWTLLRDSAHWEFELFLIFLFDCVLGLIVWPTVKKKILHHKSDDEKIAELERFVAHLKGHRRGRRIRHVLVTRHRQSGKRKAHVQ